MTRIIQWADIRSKRMRFHTHEDLEIEFEKVWDVLYDEFGNDPIGERALETCESEILDYIAEDYGSEDFWRDVEDLVKETKKKIIYEMELNGESYV